MFTSFISDTLRTIIGALNYPVIIILLALIVVVIVLLGSLIAEIFTERRHLKVKLPKLVDDLNSAERPTRETIQKSGLLNCQKEILVELTKHPDITPSMREAMALRLLEQEQQRRRNTVTITDWIARIAPMIGLMGTLIPLGPGLVALGQGDTLTLSNSLLTAFDTTVAGLVVAVIALLISTVRKSWYSQYLSILESLTECVLEVEARDAEEESQSLGDDI
ncbi:MAG: MotA/TolQ/ExbB proton channel family protein [Bacteroidales bacterium]|nr:MotA/TolQ/ExbB proton channel family protein [Bacteroidales bacterium]